MQLPPKAAAFAQKWRGKGYEKGETQLFYRDLFEIFGVPVERVAVFEHAVKRLGKGSGFIDLFWKGRLLVEQKSAGSNLAKAKEQAFEYCEDLSDAEHPRYVMLSDFQTFELYDLRENAEAKFTLADLPAHIHKLAFIGGDDKPALTEQEQVNIKASELVGDLHDALRDVGYAGHDLERLLVRIVFCLFADDTGIFNRNAFQDLIQEGTAADGSDVGTKLSILFQALNTPAEQRQSSLDAPLAEFPYINGALFQEGLRIPAFDAAMRERLIKACLFDWTAISPAIFGSLFQSVMDKEARRTTGAHYTTEPNILKLIESLFLKELRMEFNRAKRLRSANRAAKLKALQQKLSELAFFDPACGCGNFLIIAYRELRALEIKIIRELRKNPDQTVMDVAELSMLNVDQFYGIEISEFPARIAEAAMWMMDHIMNKQMSEEFGEYYIRIPLQRSPTIIHGDALELNWADILPPRQCDYVMGNPPFVGYSMLTNKQREQMRRVVASKGAGGLDYVSAWFIKAGQYIQQGDACIGFVATNSITQGDQVDQLWPILFDRCGLEITFAHQTFAWGSDARGKAHVHVVIIGLDRRANAPDQLSDSRPRHSRASGNLESSDAPCSLFSYPDVKGDYEESVCAAISPYLFDASDFANPHITVRGVSKPLNGLPPMSYGTKPTDGGRYILTGEERREFLSREPGAEKFTRPYVGSKEFIQGGDRWILDLRNAEPGELAKLPLVKERIAEVRKFRQASKKPATRKLAETPTLYEYSMIPDAPFLLVPRVSSERRDYAPIGYLEPPVVPSDAAFAVVNASKSLFGLLTSAMHMAWLHYVGGRLKSDYRYSNSIVYNTFPVPAGGHGTLEPFADAILQARAAHPDSTLADLYDPDTMPPALRKAHQKLDKAVDRLYAKTPFPSNVERAAHLLSLYEQR